MSDSFNKKSGLDKDEIKGESEKENNKYDNMLAYGLAFLCLHLQ